MRIGVLTGGSSAERAVAIATAASVVPALREGGHTVGVVDSASGHVPSAQEETFLNPDPGHCPPSLAELRRFEQSMLLKGLGEIPTIRDADIVFIALHGGAGEDGTIQAILDVLGVPYTGSGRLASALAMDKDLSKQLFRAVGIGVPGWRMGRVPNDEIDALGWPVIVKPSKQGSTVGLSLVKRSAELDHACGLAAQYDDEIMIEQFISGREMTVTILGDRALPVGEIIPRHEIFDYECKYVPGMAEEIFPAELPDAVATEMQRLALLAHRTLKLGGYSRVDFRLDPNGAIFCLEANTLPGLTKTSLVPQAARAAAISFGELCHEICVAVQTNPSTPEHGGP